MAIDQFWNRIDKKYKAKEGILSRASLKFLAFGLVDPDKITDYVDTAISYYAERPHLYNKWVDDEHLVNAIVWKAIRIWKDEGRKLNREIEIIPIIDEEGGEDDEGVIDYMAIQNGTVEEQEKYQRNNPDYICEQKELAMRALEAMTSAQRKAHEYLANGFTREEIAEKMNMNYDALCKLLQRGSQAARRVL